VSAIVMVDPNVAVPTAFSSFSMHGMAVIRCNGAGSATNAASMAAAAMTERRACGACTVASQGQRYRQNCIFVWLSSPRALSTVLEKGPVVMAVGRGNIHTWGAAQDSGNLQQNPTSWMHQHDEKREEKLLRRAPRRLSPALLRWVPSPSVSSW